MNAVIQQISALQRATRIDLAPGIGSDISGLSLLDLSDADVQEIKLLLADRGVLVFRDQPMSLEQHIALGRRFGELHVHPAFADKDHPEALRIHADGTSRKVAGETWHTDVSCDLEPPAISMLRIEVTPTVGGDTAFASMYGAFEALSKPMQAFLLERQAIHSGDLPYRGYYKAQAAVDYPSNSHPVVRTHPLNGRRALYVNSGFTDRIRGLTGLESKAMLQMLFDHIAYSVEIQCRVRWQPNSVTFWDNRCVQHYASWDYFPQTRSGWRITTKGEQPYLDL